MKEIQELPMLEDCSDRRKFLKRAGFAGLGVAGSSVLGATAVSLLSAPNAKAAFSANDIDILNFALNLEYLEAEFYTKVTTGKTIEQIGIPINGVGREGPTMGGGEVNLVWKDSDGDDVNMRGIALEIASDEQAHVRTLRAALGNQAIAKPEINLNALGQVTTPYQFVVEARAFEDVGVSAYGGAAPLIQSKEVLATAARIALTEGEHVGNIRLICYIHGVRTFALDRLDILPPPSGPDYFSNNNQGLTVVRTPSEVLAIVYANSRPGTNHGGFFPQGVNGAITTV